jgi:pimeloyl-ACP methyl ester carboxylesterase
MPDLDTRVAISADGTAIEYFSAGRGPDVIVIPGTLAMASDLTAFAALLAERYTVHVMQRRGRGGSGPQGEKYGVERECEDIEAIHGQTGARLVFGHSYGGLTALQAARGSASFDAIATYEPGVSVHGSIPVDWVDRARREVSAGADFEAFITFLGGVNPDVTGRIPRPLLRAMLRRTIPPAELRQKLTLMPEACNEYGEAGRLADKLADYHEVTAATLVMSGKGRATSKRVLAMARLAEALPRCESMIFPRLEHVAPEKEPDQVADAVLRFFAAHAQAGTEVRSQTRA